VPSPEYFLSNLKSISFCTALCASSFILFIILLYVVLLDAASEIKLCLNAEFSLLAEATALI